MISFNGFEILRNKRLKKGLSLRSLAKLSNLSTTYISLVENGKLRPSLNYILKLCNACNLSFEEELELTSVFKIMHPAISEIIFAHPLKAYRMLKE